MKGNVLIIDDEDKLRSLLSRIIGLEGFTVFEAANVLILAVFPSSPDFNALG